MIKVGLNTNVDNKRITTELSHYRERAILNKVCDTLIAEKEQIANRYTFLLRTNNPKLFRFMSSDEDQVLLGRKLVQSTVLLLRRTLLTKEIPAVFNNMARELSFFKVRSDSDISIGKYAYDSMHQILSLLDSSLELARTLEHSLAAVSSRLNVEEMNSDSKNEAFCLQETFFVQRKVYIGSMMKNVGDLVPLPGTLEKGQFLTKIKNTDTSEVLSLVTKPWSLVSAIAMVDKDIGESFSESPFCSNW